jgi:hypothetical protein
VDESSWFTILLFDALEKRNKFRTLYLWEEFVTLHLG